MNDNLVVDNDDIQNDPLMKEIKKMLYIKYLNVLLSILRFFLICFIQNLNKLLYSYFNKFIFFDVILILPTITIYLLIVAIVAICQRDFLKRDECNCCPGIILCLFCFWCYLCCMAKNLTFLKILTFILFLIELSWSFVLLYFYIGLEASNKGILIRIIITLFDSLLLLSQFYCFSYFNYFLGKIEKYIEYYKRLIIKNKKEEASFVRDTLPVKIEDYIDHEENELQDI